MDTKIDIALFAIESDCVQKVLKNDACADLIRKAFLLDMVMLTLKISCMHSTILVVLIDLLCSGVAVILIMFFLFVSAALIPY